MSADPLPPATLAETPFADLVDALIQACGVLEDAGMDCGAQIKGMDPDGRYDLTSGWNIPVKDAALIQERDRVSAALLASHAALEQRVATAQAQLDAGYNIRRYVAFVLAGEESADVQLAADRTSEKLQRAEQRVRDLEAALDSITERTSYSIDPVLAFEEALSRARAALRGTGEGNRG